MRNNGLYIHIPFCVSKCAYCDFLSFEGAGHDVMERYTRALVNELGTVREGNYTVDTVYIGGGTPTALPLPFLLEIIGAVNKLDLTPDAEFTVEMNPGSIEVSPSARPQPSFAALAALRAHGVNRLSIGLLAWQDGLLRTLGRIHTRAQFIENYRAARRAGFDNISADLMFALPNQTMAQWEESLAELISLGPEHISAYSLTPEEGTPLWGQIESGAVKLPGDDADRGMYHAARRILADAGYVHYELSNFALPGYESRHNTRYWTRAPYVGAGLGAHGFDGAARRHNTTDMRKYLSGVTADGEVEYLSNRDALAEEMILGLRMMRGVKRLPFFKEETDGLIRRGLLSGHGDTVRLTELGMDLANQVFMVFLE